MSDTMTAAERRDHAKRLKQDLERQEETSLSGLAPRTQKQRLIDTQKISRMFPERQFRYVRKDRVDEREDEGYAVVSEAEAKKAGMGATRSDMVLMAIKKEVWTQKRRQIEHENRRRLGASRGEFLAEVASEERRLRSDGAITDGQSLLVNDAD